jgi:hypothetical protein
MRGARLYALIARGARKAVVFRRGPSKSVLLLAWDLANDKLEAGQWLKGRIYERRCDLSPDGELLVYFAASYRGPWRTWTAVSRPPYLTALLAWPKGDAWGGGGLFRNDRSLQLNHPPSGDMSPAPEFSLPTHFAVEPLGEASGRGEDDPIAGVRHHRDGWRLASEGQMSDYEFDAELHWRIDPPRVIERPIRGSDGSVLQLGIHGVGERDGTWYVQTGAVASSDGAVIADLGRIDWADLDHNGDTLFAKNGCLFRLPRDRIKTGDRPGTPTLVADLNDRRFEPVAAPAFARAWPKSSPAAADRRGIAPAK